MRRLLGSLLAVLLFVAPVVAHPVPKTNRDRTIVVRVTATALVVDYRLELDEGSIPGDLTDEQRVRIKTRAELLETFTQSFATATCRTLDVSLDGQALDFQCVQHKYTATDHVRCEYRFESSWSPAPGVEHRVKFHDTNYNMDTFSRIFVYLAADESVDLLTAKVPSQELMRRSSDDRKPGDDDRLRRAEATFQLATTEPAGIYKPALPPDSLVGKNAPEESAAVVKTAPIRPATESKAAPDEAIAFDKPRQSVPTPAPSVTERPVPPETPNASGDSSIAAPSSLGARITHPNALMNLLFDSREGLALMLVVAALAGAAHALTPGHGKTMVAAYLVGQRGTYWHAVLLGIVVTLTHTSAVLAVAALLPIFHIDPLQTLTLQEFLGGFIIAAMGLWLLIRRLQGRADHFHFGGGHDHHHHHGHDHAHSHSHHHGVLAHTHDAAGGIILAQTQVQDPEARTAMESDIASGPKRTGIWEVILLGIGGGLLPCVDAVILLLLAISSGQTRLALPLLLAFSAGLATVLVLIGLAVVGAKKVAQLAAPSSNWLDRIAKPLPILSAAVITLVGLWLCYGALHP